MIGVHAAALVAVGRFSASLHRAYSLFYVIGTLGAIRVPPVGYGPLKSMEQLAPLLVFLGMQVLMYVSHLRRKHSLDLVGTLKALVKVSLPCVCVLLLLATYLFSIGYFGPLTARVRGLFVKHTRTGNPLVDSVAEHQPGSTAAYQQYLHHVYYIAPVGFILSLARWTDGPPAPSARPREALRRARPAQAKPAMPRAHASPCRAPRRSPSRRPRLYVCAAACCPEEWGGTRAAVRCHADELIG